MQNLVCKIDELVYVCGNNFFRGEIYVVIGVPSVVNFGKSEEVMCSLL